MGKSTISMAIFNSYVKLPEGIWAITREFNKKDLGICWDDNFFMFIPSLVCPSEFRYRLILTKSHGCSVFVPPCLMAILGHLPFSEKSLSIMLVGHISHIPITLPIVSTCFDSDSPPLYHVISCDIPMFQWLAQLAL